VQYQYAVSSHSAKWIFMHCNVGRNHGEQI